MWFEINIMYNFFFVFKNRLVSTSTVLLLSIFQTYIFFYPQRKKKKKMRAILKFNTRSQQRSEILVNARLLRDESFDPSSHSQSLILD